MAEKTTETLLIAIVLVFPLLKGIMAQPNCYNVIISMSSCLDYVTGNSTTPSSSCCSQLANVVSSQPQCLCQVLNGGLSSIGIDINQSQALALPKACNVQTPPISFCNSTGSSPANYSLPSVTTSSGDELSTLHSADGNSATLGVSQLFFLLCIASSASTFTTIRACCVYV